MSQTRSRVPLARIGLLAMVLLAACNDSSGPSDPPNTPPSTPPATPGSVEITIATTGDEPDADGYTVKLGVVGTKSLPANGTVTFTDVPNGSAGVLLNGIANNCILDGENPRSVAITSGQTAKVALAVSCVSTTGTITVTTATTGDDLDADGFTVALNGGSPQAIGASGTLTLEKVAVGSRTITLGGVAANCSVTGSNPVAATLDLAGSIAVQFDVSCLALPAAQDESFTALEAEVIEIDLAAISDAKGVANAAYTLGGMSNPSFTATLNGTLVTIQSPDGNGSGDIAIDYTLSTDAGSATATLSGSVDGMTDYRFTLKEVFGDSVIHSPASLQIDGTTYDFVNGVIEGQMTPGRKTIHLVTNGATHDADHIALSTGDVRVLFPKFNQDTLTFGDDFTAVIKRPSNTEANFDMGHYLATFDNATASAETPFVGQQAPRSDRITIFVQTKFDVTRNTCREATPITLQYMRDLQSRIAANLSGTYDVVTGEGAVGPAQSDGVLVLCASSNATAVGTQYGALGQFQGGTVYILNGSVGDERVFNQLGNIYPFGAVNEDSQCRVRTVFSDESDCAAMDRTANMSTDVSAYDRNEGLIMGYYYARHAASRHLASNGSIPYFTLRP